jgi:RNA polymerase sigma factor (sigma-70 family)
MASASLLRHIADCAPDADLLHRFVHDRDADAFAELVRRHGPVVYRVCRRLLGVSLADDAFQATFLILATRPGSVRQAGSVGSWLVGVAGRVARQMRKRERRLQASGGRQSPEEEHTRGTDVPRSLELVEQFRILDEELTRLPDRLRGPVVVCLLQGRTQEQAVAELGGSVRTIRRRLEEAKQLLRLRLERRGVVPAVAAGLVAGIGAATAAVPPDLPGQAVATVFDFLAGGAAVSAPAAVIAKGVAMGTLARKVKLAMVSAAVGLTALGVGLADDGGPKPLTQPGGARPAPVPRVTAPQPIPARPAPAMFVPNAGSGTARAIENEVLFQWKQIAPRWLGIEPPVERMRPLHVIDARADEPIPPPVSGQLTVVYRRGGPSGSMSELTFADGRLTQPWVHLAGPLEEILDNDLPREMTHVVLAEHVGKPLPRWAADGTARTAESAAKQAEYDRVCRELIEQGKAVRLSVLFRMTEAPKGQAHAVTQGHSVTRYLLTRKAVLKSPADGDSPLLTELWRRSPEAAFLAFVQLGEGDWDRAVKAVYGFDDVAAMEKAWLGWLSTPESRLEKTVLLRLEKATTKGSESPHIPPAKRPGGM